MHLSRIPSLVMMFMLISTWASAVVADVKPHDLHDYVPDELLVKFKSGTLAAARHGIAVKTKGQVTARYRSFGIERWKLPKGKNLETAIAELKASGAVEYAEPNYRRYRRFPASYGDYVNQAALTTIHMDEAQKWVNGNLSAPLSESVVAIIDDGIDINHDALLDYIWTNPNEAANDAKGYVGDIHGWDFVDNDPDPSPELCEDGQGYADHGTQVASMIAAMAHRFNDSKTPNWPVRIMPLRVGCFYSVAHELLAMQYAIDNGAAIINASYGGPQYSLGERAAVQALADANVLLVAAAGNYDGNNDRVPDYPSSLDLPNVIAVAASSGTGSNEALTDWSNYGQTNVDVAAPGEGVITALAGGGYDTGVAGTSFSAPLTAGLAALVKSIYAPSTAQDLKGTIMGSVEPLQLKGVMSTDGRIDASKAAQQAGQMALSGQGEPVLVVKHVVVVDSGNGELDANETVTLQVTLENVWKDATSIDAVLTQLDPVDVAVTADSASYGAVAEGSIATVNFEVKVGDLQGYHRIPFELDITATADAPNTTQVSFQRFFELELGTLYPGAVVSDLLQATGNLQDEFHYFHIDVPSGSSNLTFSIQSDDPNKSVHLLVRYRSPPQFDYSGYFEPNAVVLGGVNVGTYVSAESSPLQTIRISKPRAGTWYAVAVVPGASPFEEPDQTPNLGFRISANYGKGSDSTAGGCTVASTAEFDPILLSLIVGSMAFLTLRRRKRCL